MMQVCMSLKNVMSLNNNKYINKNMLKLIVFK